MNGLNTAKPNLSYYFLFGLVSGGLFIMVLRVLGGVCYIFYEKSKKRMASNVNVSIDYYIKKKPSSSGKVIQIMNDEMIVNEKVPSDMIPIKFDDFFDSKDENFMVNSLEGLEKNYKNMDFQTKIEFDEELKLKSENNEEYKIEKRKKKKKGKNKTKKKNDEKNIKDEANKEQDEKDEKDENNEKDEKDEKNEILPLNKMADIKAHLNLIKNPNSDRNHYFHNPNSSDLDKLSEFIENEKIERKDLN